MLTMRKQLFRLPISITFLLFQTAVQGAQEGEEPKTFYGQAAPEAGKVVHLSTAITQIGESTGHLQKISGVVTKVCRKKGCWMILTDEGSHARITFKDYAFFVPADTGRVNAVVYGKLTEATLSEKRAKHYAQDAGKSGEDIKGSVKEYSIVASGVSLSW